MDATIANYMGLRGNDALAAASDCLARCRAVGGVFTLLWHNDRLLVPELRWLYEQLLAALEGPETYDWKSEVQQARMDCAISSTLGNSCLLAGVGASSEPYRESVPA
jgi:hypothetical protein